MDTSELEEQLKPVELVPGTEYLLGVFGELSRSRTSDMNGSSPITYTSIKDYCWVMDETLDRWEVKAILVMDAAFLDESSKVVQTT